MSPDIFDGKSIEEISRLKVWEGNKTRCLSDLFNIKVEESGDEITINLVGDFIKVRNVGANMSRGKIIVDGSIGMHLGEGMNG
ncbi:MAG: formylmethanofuran dehydrogenase subunit C, partial [Candidatus Bathyarchaeota archaeon]|nr:formylmethanofuran dehydrogenase subunit C [Candidatus Bathyarchaeota archaeon]